MANEIRITLQVNYQNGTAVYNYTPGTINLPQTNKGFFTNTIAVTTAEADVSIGGITAQGLMYMHNLEATTTGKSYNYGLKSSTGGIPQYFRLAPKEIAGPFRYGTTAMILRGKAASGALSVLVTMFEA